MLGSVRYTKIIKRHTLYPQRADNPQGRQDIKPNNYTKIVCDKPQKWYKQGAVGVPRRKDHFRFIDEARLLRGNGIWITLKMTESTERSVGGESILEMNSLNQDPKAGKHKALREKCEQLSLSGWGCMSGDWVRERWEGGWASPGGPVTSGKQWTWVQGHMEHSQQAQKKIVYRTMSLWIREWGCTGNSSGDIDLNKDEEEKRKRIA